jgi:hypothetical protein
MSPEQCRGEPLDRRSDIFSLGILMHEMTLGRRLFRGETDFQILKQIAEGPITRPRDVDANYDERLQRIVMKALERDPERRFQTARELQEAVEELAHDMRMRQSPLALADYMRALFGDKIGAWERASADGDRKKLEAHFATMAAEREADLAAEEAAPYCEPPPSDVQLSSLPDDELAPRRRRRARSWIAIAMVVVAAAGGWRYRGKLAALWKTPAVSVEASAVRAAVAPTELPTPKVEEEGAAATEATAAMEVVTTPAGATLVLDGKTLAEKSPARVVVAAGVAHTLLVRSTGRAGVAQRFMLDAGEDATMEIDLRRSAHAAVKKTRVARAAATVAPTVTERPAPTPTPTQTPTTSQKVGEGSLVIASSPWCEVSVDGVRRGTTPLSVKLKAGAHEVVLVNAEFKIRRSLAVEIEAGQTVRKSLDFAPE